MAKMGLDIGTCNILSASQDANSQIQIKTIRDCFLDLEKDPTVTNMLKMSKVDFIEEDDKLYIIGDSALNIANMFQRNTRRPLSRGVLSAGELEAEKIVKVLIEHVIGKAETKDDICYFSVPGAPIDRDMDVVYHQAMLAKIINSLGYTNIQPLNEAAAIAYSNAAPELFSALTISFGSGMTNVCLMYQTVVGMTFSLSRGGDYIDNAASIAVAQTASKIQFIKEKGINLLDANDAKDDDDRKKFLREREALIIYYKSLILYALDSIKKEFIKRQGKMVELPKAVPLILSGGTALAKNFLEFFKSAFDTIKDFPIRISEVRMVKEPLNAVALGLLVAALNHKEEQKK